MLAEIQEFACLSDPVIFIRTSNIVHLLSGVARSNAVCAGLMLLLENLESFFVRIQDPIVELSPKSRDYTADHSVLLALGPRFGWIWKVALILFQEHFNLDL